jgi:hypothetical protein
MIDKTATAPRFTFANCRTRRKCAPPFDVPLSRYMVSDGDVQTRAGGQGAAESKAVSDAD